MILFDFKSTDVFLYNFEMYCISEEPLTSQEVTHTYNQI